MQWIYDLMAKTTVYGGTFKPADTLLSLRNFDRTFGTFGVPMPHPKPLPFRIPRPLAPLTHPLFLADVFAVYEEAQIDGDTATRDEALEYLLAAVAPVIYSTVKTFYHPSRATDEAYFAAVRHVHERLCNLTEKLKHPVDQYPNDPISVVEPPGAEQCINGRIYLGDEPTSLRKPIFRWFTSTSTTVDRLLDKVRDITRSALDSYELHKYNESDALAAAKDLETCRCLFDSDSKKSLKRYTYDTNLTIADHRIDHKKAATGDEADQFAEWQEDMLDCLEPSDREIVDAIREYREANDDWDRPGTAIYYEISGLPRSTASDRVNAAKKSLRKIFENPPAPPKT